MTFPDISPIAFSVGPLDVRWYGLAYLAGIVGAAFVAYRYAQRWRLGLTIDDLLTIVLGASLGVVVGGRIGWVLFYGGPDYWGNPGEALAIWNGGMSFHGGLIGIMVAGYVVSRILGIPWLRLCDLGALGAPIGLGLGRLANFANAELWGRATDVPWGVVFPGAGPLPRHPSQLYEAFLEGLVLFLFMLVLARKLRPDGELVGWLLVFYGFARTFVEYFREPDADLGFLVGDWLTMGMLLSVPLIAAGAVLIVRARRSRSGQVARGSKAS